MAGGRKLGRRIQERRRAERGEMVVCGWVGLGLRGIQRRGQVGSRRRIPGGGGESGSGRARATTRGVEESGRKGMGWNGMRGDWNSHDGEDD